MIKLWRKRWFRKQRQFKRSMRGGRLHAILGRHAFHPKVWRSDKRAIAGGLAAGLFTAFTPTIPFQMLMAAVIAIYFKVNLPIALAACWVTNPLTTVPIFMAARTLGKKLLTHNEHITAYVDLFLPAGQFGRFLRESIYLTSGSLILATLAAVAGYLAIQVLWVIMDRLGVFRKRPPKPPPTITSGQTEDNGQKSKIENRKQKVEITSHNQRSMTNVQQTPIDNRREGRRPRRSRRKEGTLAKPCSASTQRKRSEPRTAAPRTVSDVVLVPR